MQQILFISNDIQHLYCVVDKKRKLSEKYLLASLRGTKQSVIYW